jgi:hypothetical protein
MSKIPKISRKKLQKRLIFEVQLRSSKNVFLQAEYLYTDSLLTTITFEILHLSSYALNIYNDVATVGKTFGTPAMELLSVSSSHIFTVFNILKSSHLWGRLLFLEKVTGHRKPNQGNMVGFAFQ